MEKLFNLITNSLLMPVNAEGFIIDVPTAIDSTVVNSEFMDKFSELQGFAGQLFVIIIGLSLFIAMIAFVLAAFNYGKGGDNAKSKQTSYKSFIVIGVTTACLGAFPLIIWVFILILGAMQ